jgi:hypothetical protein
VICPNPKISGYAKYSTSNIGTGGVFNYGTMAYREVNESNWDGDPSGHAENPDYWIF